MCPTHTDLGPRRAAQETQRRAERSAWLGEDGGRGEGQSKRRHRQDLDSRSSRPDYRVKVADALTNTAGTFDKSRRLEHEIPILPDLTKDYKQQHAAIQEWSCCNMIVVKAYAITARESAAPEKYDFKTGSRVVETGRSRNAKARKTSSSSSRIVLEQRCERRGARLSTGVAMPGPPAPGYSRAQAFELIPDDAGQRVSTDSTATGRPGHNEGRLNQMPINQALQTELLSAHVLEEPGPSSVGRTPRLNEDVLTHIVSYLSTHDALNMSLTSRDIYTIAKRHALSVVTMRSNAIVRICTYMLDDIPGRLHWVRELQVCFHNIDGCFFFAVELSDTAARLLVSLFENAIHLKSLRIPYLVDTLLLTQPRIAPALSALHHLEILDLELSPAESESERNAEVFAIQREMLREMRSRPVELSLWIPSFSDLSSIQHIQTIRRLTLSRLNSHNEEYPNHAQGSQLVLSWPTVSSLTLNRCRLSMSQAVRAFPNLRELCVRYPSSGLTSTSSVCWPHMDYVKGPIALFKEWSFNCHVHYLMMTPMPYFESADDVTVLDTCSRQLNNCSARRYIGYLRCRPTSSYATAGLFVERLKGFILKDNIATGCSGNTTNSSKDCRRGEDDAIKGEGRDRRTKRVTERLRQWEMRLGHAPLPIARAQSPNPPPLLNECPRHHFQQTQ
ncbi:predicted protein [Postia placenta Mad-698-R]|uniref:F-box domain-containing protein n=1 Tax=Postia placenta MAD-698-R-SB12 TaxID=670580 RepID=A0A1X6N5Q6_9APHY|nr:hypothetical protein POSPLADRAFT_1136687 [Postia placenta MAD-698-R-SB12]EED80685.1 predicted protein [Postia placenta Mad-698-R]OSX63816.1 hypothetical protein POSPLADRAFT_1136687 [Postia placenta MAD-698-R-SB12]